VKFAKKEEGRRKKEEGMGVNLTSNVVPAYCLTMIAQIPRYLGVTHILHHSQEQARCLFHKE